MFLCVPKKRKGTPQYKSRFLLNFEQKTAFVLGLRFDNFLKVVKSLIHLKLGIKKESGSNSPLSPNYYKQNQLKPGEFILFFS
jgi:hypothetical protein